MNRLILASASPRRRELLARLGVPFEVIVADVVENEDPSTPPALMVSRNAALKADAVARLHPDAVVLGADTTVHLDGHSLSKPADLAEARAMLRRLSARRHTVFTAVALRRHPSTLHRDGVASSEVTFRRLDDALIENYLKNVHVLDKAGAYGIQEKGEDIVEGISGELETVIGLPMTLTKQFLTEAGLLR